MRLRELLGWNLQQHRGYIADQVLGDEASIPDPYPLTYRFLQMLQTWAAATHQVGGNAHNLQDLTASMFPVSSQVPREPRDPFTEAVASAMFSSGCVHGEDWKRQ